MSWQQYRFQQQWSREFSLGRFSVTIVTGSPTSYLMPPRPCHAKSGQASFRILFAVGNEAGSHSTHEVSPSCLQEHTASPITGEQPYQLDRKSVAQGQSAAERANRAK